MNNISIINDEISNNLKDAILFCKSHKLSYLELRSIDKNNICNISRYKLIRYAKYLKKNNIKVSCIASPLLKWLPKNIKFENISSINIDKFYFNKNNYTYEKIFQIADIFNTKYIRIFSFLRYKNFSIDHLDTEMNKLIVLAEKYNKVLLIENEPTCNISTVNNLYNFVNRYNNKRVRILLDIGNLYKNKDSLNDKSLSKIYEFIEYIHIKDYNYIFDKYVILGQGNINYKKHISFLNKNIKRKIFYSMETHVNTIDQYGNSSTSIKYLRDLLTQKRISYGIVGCGRIFNKHIGAIKLSKHSELIGVFDINKSKMIKQARLNDCKYYSNIKELINDVDVVNICVPHNIHTSIIKSVLDRDKKCLCEKPGCLGDRDAKKVIKNKKYKNNVFVVYQNRFNKAIIETEKIIKSKNLGNLLYVFGNVRWFREKDYYKNSWQGQKKFEGGILFNQGIHLIDIMMKYCKNEKEIKIINAYKDKIYHKDLNTEDIFLAQFKYNKTIFNLEVTVSASPHNLGSGIIFIFENGRIEIGREALNKILEVSMRNNNNTINLKDNIKDVYGHGHIDLIEALSQHFLFNKKCLNLVGYDESCKRVNFINKLYKAI